MSIKANKNPSGWPLPKSKTIIPARTAYEELIEKAIHKQTNE
jgi:hypothetical protein